MKRYQKLVTVDILSAAREDLDGILSKAPVCSEQEE